MRKLAFAALILATAVMALVSPSPVRSRAAGADVVIGHGERANAVFSFTAVFTPSGKINGRARVEVPGLGFTGRIECGSIHGNIAVVGGTSDSGLDFVLMLSDNPDGIIVGTGRPNCDTTGFGDPASLPLASGFIKVIDH